MLLTLPRRCYLGKVLSSVWQLDEDGDYQGNSFEKGYWVFEMHWFEYKRTTVVPGWNGRGRQPEGDRVYQLNRTGGGKQVMQLNGVVTGADEIFFKEIRSGPKGGGGKQYILSKECHNLLLADGNLE